MNRIPYAVKQEIIGDPFYERCCLEDENCDYKPGARRIEWHHTVIFAGRQVQEKWAILPACSGYHHRFAARRDIAERFIRVAVSRASEEELLPFCKVIDYINIKRRAAADATEEKIRQQVGE